MSSVSAQVDLPDLPRHKGCYVLLLELTRPVTLTVGRFGPLDFAGGLYAYVGSALGPGGLAARLKHHLKPAKRCHWHLDYLRLRAPVVAVWTVWGREVSGNLNECRLADRFARHAFLNQPFKGFGSSDCTCFSHLLHWASTVDKASSFSAFLTSAIAHLDEVLCPMIRLCC